MRILIFFLLVGIFFSCTQEKQELPILGRKKIENGDTLFHKIPDFTFVNQDSSKVSNRTFQDKVYVTDFFFTACPTICPKVKKQMLRIYKQFEDDPRIVLLSHTIDVKRDTVGRLKTYASNLGVEADRWHFVTGDKDAIYDIADDYFSIAIEDETVPGGFDHSGRLILVDHNRHVRSFCDGTLPEEVDEFMEDIQFLLASEYTDL